MTDTSQTQPAPAARPEDSLRGSAILAYILYLIGWPSLHLATIVALIIAYVQRPDARGTVWESHFTNLIETFWISLVIGVIAVPLCFVGIGFLILGGLVVWFLYRTIKGLVHAIDGKPYA